MSISDDLARIALQEQELQFASFDEETAWRLGSRLRAMAIEREFKIVIDVRRFGQPLFYTALAGTVPDNVDWVRRKSNVTARFLRSSYAIGLEMEAKQSNLFDRYGLAVSEYASHGGCFPLRVVQGICGELGRDYESLRLDG
jgi:uncharacterized protein (UPF0303 family)